MAKSNAEHARGYRQRRKAQGLCAEPGCSNSRGTYTRCAAHRAERAAQANARRSPSPAGPSAELAAAQAEIARLNARVAELEKQGQARHKAKDPDAIDPQIWTELGPMLDRQMAKMRDDYGEILKEWTDKYDELNRRFEALRYECIPKEELAELLGEPSDSNIDYLRNRVQGLMRFVARRGSAKERAAAGL